METIKILKKIKPLKTRPWPHHNQDGVAILFFISMILVMSVLTGFLLDLTTTSTLGELSHNHTDRAYFMAEAGGHYALRLVREDINADGIYDDTHLLHDQTYIMEGGDGDSNEEGRFQILVDDTDPGFTLVTSIGTINVGISTRVRSQLTYRMDRNTPETFFKELLFGDEKLEIKDDAYIDGDVATNDTSIIKESGVVIEGSEQVSAGRTLAVIPLGYATSSDPITISEGTWRTFSPGTYNAYKVTIGANSTITFSGDVVWYKEEVKIEQNVKFRFLEDASLTLYVDKIAEFGEDFVTSFIDTPDRPQDFVIVGTTNAETIDIKKRSVFIGIIYAPSAQVKFGDDLYAPEDSDGTGALVGREIVIGKNAQMIWSPIAAYVSAPVNGIGSRLVSAILADPVQYFSR
jgi:hypothetical protein